MTLNKNFENNTKKYMEKTLEEKMLPFYYMFLILICIGLYMFYNSYLKGDYIEINRLDIIEEQLELKYNETTKINVVIEPNNATIKDIKWTSSNSKLITVDNLGNLKVLKNENAKVTITATARNGGHKDSVVINIKKVDSNNNSNNNNPNNNSNNKPNNKPNDNTNNKPNNNANSETSKPQNIKVTGINLDRDKLQLKYNEQKKINVIITPENATNKKVIYTSNDTSLVTVDDDGNVRANSSKIGITTINVKTQDGGHSQTIEVKVLPSGNAISFIGNKNYSNYKVNMLLYRTNSVMQNFAFLNNDLLISQGRLSSLQGAYISKINMNEVKNNVNTPQEFQSSTAILNNYGHADALDIETTNGVNYLWTDCYYETSPATHCRIKLNDIKFSSEPYANNNLNVSLKVSGPNMVAIDSDNRTLVFLNATTTKEHTFVVYNLDDYILNKDKAKVISEFKVTNKVYGISRQGIDVYGNYIYSYEGNATNLDKKHVVYVSVHTLDGETIVYRKPIDYPDNIYCWEPEGIKIQNNNIYIGFAKIDKDKKQKTANIYKLN